MLCPPVINITLEAELLSMATRSSGLRFLARNDAPGDRLSSEEPSKIQERLWWQRYEKIGWQGELTKPADHTRGGLKKKHQRCLDSVGKLITRNTQRTPKKNPYDNNAWTIFS